MTEVSRSDGKVTFSRFILDPDRGALLYADSEIALRPKSFDVLRYLVEHNGRLVTQEELLDAVWPDTVVTANSVRQCIKDVRSALQDHDHRILRTIPRRGYCFVMPPAPADATGDTDQAAAGPARRTARLVAAGVAAVAVMLATAAALKLWNTGDPGADAARPAPPANSIAVLRFADMSPAGDHAYLAEGLAEEILHRLAQNTALRVTARTSSFAVAEDDIATIRRKLNVANVLEGSVRRSENQIRVTVQLVESAGGTHRWSMTYDREFDDILELEADIAEAVARSLDVTPGIAGASSPTESALAHAEYLQGRFFYQRRNPGDLDLAEARFGQALAIDPEYARAWVGLAAILNIMSHQRLAQAADPRTLAELRERHRYAAERALEFGPELPDTQMRAAAYYWYAGDRERALGHVQKAEQLDPDHWLVLSARAAEAASAGRIDAAIDRLQASARYDPLNNVILLNLTHFLFLADRLEEALAVIRKIHELYPSSAESPNLSGLHARTLMLLGENDAARRIIDTMAESPQRLQCRALLHHALGQTAESSRALAALEAEADSPEELLALAEVHAQRDDVVQTLAWLRRLTPMLGCHVNAVQLRAVYSPYLDSLDGGAALRNWHSAVAQRLAECRF